MPVMPVAPGPRPALTGLLSVLMAGCWTAPLARHVAPRRDPVNLEGVSGGRIRVHLVVGGSDSTSGAHGAGQDGTRADTQDLPGRITSIDVSYRRLTIAYPDGRHENLRVQDAGVLTGLRLGEAVRITATELEGG